MAPSAEPARHDRPQPVGSNSESRSQRVPPARLIADHDSGHAALFVQELLDAGSLHHGGTRRASGGKQFMVEDATRDRESGRAEWMVAREGRTSHEPWPQGAR